MKIKNLINIFIIVMIFNCRVPTNPLGEISIINQIGPINTGGNCVDIEKYENYCNEKKNFLIFDNAASSYTFYKGKNIFMI